MSVLDHHAIRSELLASAADVCSRHWTALGGLPRALGELGCKSIVDPEALILLSLVAREVDPRLEERLGWWAREGARHTSVQRTRTLVERFPSCVQSAWKSFAVVAGRHGGASWRVHAEDSLTPPLRERAKAELQEAALIEDSALLLRLRLGFGVNAKADLLAFLIGSPDARFTVSSMAHELAYFETTIQRASRNMARAGLIHEYVGHPVSYTVDRLAWLRMLELDSESGSEPPRWRSWSIVFPFVAHAIDWGPTHIGASAYIRASRARDLYESSRRDLERLGLGIAKPEGHRGDEFEHAFVELLARVATWMKAMA